MKTHPLLKIANSTFIDMPSPSSISFNWNFGSLLGVILLFQIISGLLMTFPYTSDMNLAFSSIIQSRESSEMWITRWTHANGASLMFLLLYLHIGRNMYYSSFKKMETWTSGMVIFVLVMMTAFMGYILPWGQMSYWGATVITNLLSAIPSIGPDVVVWLWGGFSVSNPTLSRFYSIHFLLPFIILALVLLHLSFLHQYGSSNPLNLQNWNDMLFFHPYFIMKDLIGLLLVIIMFSMIILINPLMLNDAENFNLANFMSTPPHIQPEWYFLFAYAILRSIPNKLGGILAMILAIAIFFFIPFITKIKISLKFKTQKKLLFWMFIMIFILLTWVGMNPVELPFTTIGAFLSLSYFILFSLLFSM